MKKQIILAGISLALAMGLQADGNRLSHLNARDPFYVDHTFPKLTTPQWVGEAGVEAVVILAIDDMSSSGKYEEYLRPILDRLKQIDGRAPVSIFSNALNEAEPKFQSWLDEGLSFEVHTEHHPCPLLSGGDLSASLKNVYRSVDRLDRIPHNSPTAYRMPCCDSINSPSPRFYSEIFSRVTEAGAFLKVDSSIVNLFTSADPDLPEDILVDPDGEPRFTKYTPFPSFATTIENYPYPYVFNRVGWEFPCAAPSDWEAQNLHGVNNPETVEDWKRCLDATVLKQGVMTWVFHPHGWIRSDQMVEWIDDTVERYGNRVLFLTFPEALERLNQNLLKGQSLRGFDGEDGGARLLDLNNDGYLDVALGAQCERTTRIWDPENSRWVESAMPVLLAGKPEGFPERVVTVDPVNEKDEPITVSKSALDWDPGVQWGVLKHNNQPTVVMVQSRTTSEGDWLRGAWRWDVEKNAWIEFPELWNGWEGLESPWILSRNGVDQGMRFWDVDGDGFAEALMANPDRSSAWRWDAEALRWEKSDWTLPDGANVVDVNGRDDGLRWIDLNGDGHDDVIHSNAERYSVHLYMPEWLLGWPQGWTREAMAGFRAESSQVKGIPVISRGGEWPNNGAWFRRETLWVQNEDTASMPDLVDRRAFKDLLAGDLAAALTSSESLAAIEIHSDFTVELVVSEPLIQDPVAIDWGEDGSLWVVEMRDYPRGLDSEGEPGGVVKKLEDLDGDGLYDRSTTYLSGLNFPNGIQVWGKGAWISAAPDILWTEDTDGDGRADVVEEWASGFREGNQQHRVNGFEWGLDGWLNIANGDSSGRITGKVEGDVLNLSGRDLKLHPVTGALDWTHGQTQFGRRRDDWGNWFGNNNPNWLWHYVIGKESTQRNPHAQYFWRKNLLAQGAEMTLAYPISAQPQRFNVVGASEHVTSANSPTSYRDNWFGPDMENAIFISEPAQSLIRRFHLTPNGVSFDAHKVAEEEEKEFLASRDPWFRPTQLKIGPDGALYIADMYRQHIEHPEYIPDDVDQWTTFREGETLGRIYRVVPKNSSRPRRPIADLTELSPSEWLLALESPNGWIRDHAQAKLMHVLEATDELKSEALDLFRKNTNQKTRIHLLWVLDHWDALPSELLASVLKNEQPKVSIHALKVLENHVLRHPDFQINPDLFQALIASADLSVQFQTALTMGALGDRLEGDLFDPHWTSLASKSTAADSGALQEALLAGAAHPRWSLLLQTIAQALDEKPDQASDVRWQDWIRTGSRVDEISVGSWTDTIEKLTPNLESADSLSESAARRIKDLSDALSEVNRSGEKWKALSSSESFLKKIASWDEALRSWAYNNQLDKSSRHSAIQTLGSIWKLGFEKAGADNLSEDWSNLLSADQPSIIQEAALAVSLDTQGAGALQLAAERWESLSPDMRRRLIETALKSEAAATVWLDVLENGTAPKNQISVFDRERFKSSQWTAVAQRSSALWNTDSEDQNTANQWIPGEGFPKQGRTLFEQQCAICHRLRGTGIAVGPDLDAFGNRPWKHFVEAIQNPDNAIDPAYQAYLVATLEGEVMSGVVNEMTEEFISLKTPGTEILQIQRDQIQSFEPMNNSLMPKGLDVALGHEGLRDVWAFIQRPPL
jgi:putative membrane-bound dehydrogenase-like protein